MKVFHSIEDIKSIGETGIVLGNFDGIHIGHKKLIKDAVDNCYKEGLVNMVFTFVNHPKNLEQAKKVRQIISWDEKISIIESMGVDYLVAIEFDNDFQKMAAENFVKDILIGKLNMKAAYCGFHYRFGHKAMGTISLLREMGKEHNFKLSVLEPVKYKGSLVSSTKIRELIAEGKMEECSQFLGRKYSLEGTVVYGKQIGKKEIGFPTANILVDETRIIPRNGVYITKCFVNNKMRNSITNIGLNPTVGGEQRMIETYIIDFDEDIYDEDIKVEFYKNIRCEIKFESIEDLRKQIDSDVNVSKMYHKMK